MTDKLKDRRLKGWFWDSNEIFDSGLSTIAIVVRLFLARCADTKGQCFPSTNTIAEKCGISRASVFNALKELEEKGWVKREQRTKNNAQTTNIYTLLMPYEETAFKTEDNPSLSGGLVQEVDGWCIRDRQGESTKYTGVVYQVDTEQYPINNTQLTIPKEEEYISPSGDQPSQEAHPEDGQLSDPSQEVIDYFNATWKDIYPRGFTPTAKRKKQILARLKVFALEDIKQAIDNLHSSDFHKGNNDRGWKATIDFLIRSDEQIDTWANNPPISKPQGGNLNGKRYDPNTVDWVAEQAKYAELQQSRGMSERELPRATCRPPWLE